MHLPPIKSVLVSVGSVALAGGLVFGGFWYGVRYAEPKRVVAITESNDVVAGDFSRFWKAVDAAKQRFVNINEVKDADILNGAIRGAIAAFGDAYTVYFDAGEAKKFNEDLAGSFGGIGAEIGIRNNQLSIISPLKGNPAEAAGLRAGDQIWKINGSSTVGMSVEEGVQKIRGKEGTMVTLSIYREGWTDTKDFSIVRRTVVLPTVDWEMKDGQIAYIHLYNFNANVTSLFFDAAVAATNAGARGVILDLRNNPGGYLDAAVNIAGWFLKSGTTVVEERLRGERSETLKTYGNAAFAETPLVVLMNAGSASASEILAGALRDNRGVKLIGEQSFGKGSVQEIEQLEDGGTLKVTIAEWFTPKGTRISKIGLRPDIEVKLTDKDIEAGRDPQLERAIIEVKKMLE